MLLATALGFVTIDMQDRSFRDEDGRQLIFHGVNAVAKKFPYMPNITGDFDPEYSIVQEDINFMARNGINFMRLGVQWPGVMPERDMVNYTYLEQQAALINKLGEAGIYTMIDMHQDVFSEYFCGEGVPDWAAPYEREGVPHFGKPLLREYTRDSVTRKIDHHECLQLEFGVYYETAIVGNMFECLYNETCNPFAPYRKEGPAAKDLILQEEMIKYWVVVADYFKDNRYVVGYDIINEPTAGNLWEHPLYYINSTQMEADVLTPFYRNVMKAIYEKDKNHIMFFEPVVTSAMPAGFPEGGPGREVGVPADKQSYAWHLYCLTIDKNGDPVQPRQLCDVQYDFWYEQRKNSGAHLGLAQLVDEFGATPDDEVARVALQTQIASFNKDGLSWAYWQYKPFGDITTCFNSDEDGGNEGFFTKNGSIQTKKVKIITHPYPQVVAGSLKSDKFDFDTETMYLKFRTGRKGEQTEIKIGQLWSHWGKDQLVVFGKGAVRIQYSPQKIVITNVLEGVDVDIVLF